MANLNESQRRAVFADVDSALIVVAPPGSGKTHCLVERVRQVLARGVPAGAVLLITFTNKAARELRERVAGAGAVRPSTFHAFCLALCRRARLVPRACSIWAGPEQKRALAAIVKNRIVRQDPNADTSANAMRPFVAQAASLLGRPLSELGVGTDERSIVDAYHRMKREQNAIDFDDMLTIVVDKLSKVSASQSPLAQYRVVLIDEWQDTSAKQLELVKLLAKHTRAITIVGDPHQSIYGWRGAEFSNWKKFKHLLKPNVVYLSTNYRSTAVISAACQGLIAYNPAPKLDDGADDDAATVLTVKPGDDPVLIVQCRDNDGEADFVAHTLRKLHDEDNVPWSEMCVLFRSNPRGRATRALEFQLIRARIPYTIVAGAALYESKAIKLCLAYLRYLVNPLDELAFDYICKERKIAVRDFEAAWRLFRRPQEPSSTALERLEAPSTNVALMGDHREGLFKLSALLRSWRRTMETDSTLSLVHFMQHFVIAHGGFGTDEDTMDKLNFLSGQVEPLQKMAEEENDSLGGERANDDEKVNSLTTQIVSFLERVALFNPSERDSDSAQGKCVLSTIHQSKGLEWEAVCVIQCLEGVIPSRQSLQKKTDELVPDVDEERRLMFVAMSRAKKRLYLSHPKPTTDQRRSRFLEEVMSSQQPKQSAKKRPTEFASARMALKRQTSEQDGTNMRVQEMNWKLDDEEDRGGNGDDNIENDELKPENKKASTLDTSELDLVSATKGTTPPPRIVSAASQLKRAKTVPTSSTASASKNAFSVLMGRASVKKK